MGQKDKADNENNDISNVDDEKEELRNKKYKQQYLNI